MLTKSADRSGSTSRKLPERQNLERIPTAFVPDGGFGRIGHLATLVGRVYAQFYQHCLLRR